MLRKGGIYTFEDEILENPFGLTYKIKKNMNILC